MNTKLYHITLGYLLLAVNIILIDTRFNLVGLGFGIAAAFQFIKALRIKK